VSLLGGVIAQSLGPGRAPSETRYARRANAMGQLFFLVTLPYAPLFAYWETYWLAATAMTL